MPFTQGRAAADKPARWRSRAENRTGMYLCVHEEVRPAWAQNNEVKP
jgi:hypothetical protein